ncbi:MAG: sugar ABC transporter ATP-binding protein [Planctomycetes bacterium]|nr:sugar ABC transporter ATP-binding protein [Planctomycetota bacterium]
MTTAPFLTMTGISKRFPGVVALSGVSLEIRAGEVLSLVGENGAGKSTLMKILGGVHIPEEGELRIDGEVVVLAGIADAKARGIALIHQELMLAPNLDVAGNIFLGGEPTLPGGRLDRARMNREAAALLARLGLDIKPTTQLARLTTGQMQLVEIAKALALKARIIIMDEPTSSLTPVEAEKLFLIIKDLTAAGIAIAYISHRFEEILRITDRISVLRDGKRVGDLLTKDTNHDQLVSMMIGRDFTTRFPPRAGKPGETVLDVQDIVVPGAPAGVSFSARRGEILGFAGLVGSGRTELMKVLFGVDRPQGGALRFAGEAFVPLKPADAIERGIYLVPEDRKLHGLVLPMPISMNITLPDIANYRPKWWLQRRRELVVANEQLVKQGIKAPSVLHKVVNLSGGNQQKVVLGKWLAMRPKLLILDEPTRGIDIGAKAEIYRQIAALADQGLTILMVSSELEEVIGMSDRVAVFSQRRLSGILEKHELNEENIMHLMTGQARNTVKVTHA